MTYWSFYRNSFSNIFWASSTSYFSTISFNLCCYF